MNRSNRQWARAFIAFSIGSIVVLGGCQPRGHTNAQLEPPLAAPDWINQAALDRIIDQGVNHNQVMDHERYLTEQIGPRLTGSDRVKRANEWTAEQFRKWGLQNVEVRQWGTIPVAFNRGPSTGRMVAPVGRDFDFTWPAWTAGTTGAVSAPVFKEPQSEEEFEAVSDKLKGAWILEKARRAGQRGRVQRSEESPIDWIAKCRELGIAGVVSAPRDGSELVHTGGNYRNLTMDTISQDLRITVRRSDYDVINSRLADGEEVALEFNCNADFVDGPIPVYNTIAEIVGSEWPDEVVIVSAHLDSWDGPRSQGAVDNATGSSVTLEAARILAAAGVKPKRTIRFILWTGEEQGLLGSRAYVDALSDEERAKISCVLVDDGGTNYEGGLQAIASMEDMLIAATAPVNEVFPDMPVKVHVRQRMPLGGGSDHAPFNAVGIPGFFWDEVGRADYRYAHHTQYDRIDQAIPEYLVQSSTCAAITAFNLANAPTLLPRQVEESEAQANPGTQR